MCRQTPKGAGGGMHIRREFRPFFLPSSQVMENLQNGGNGPGLGFTTERTVLPILIGQFWQTLPRRSDKRKDVYICPIYNASAEEKINIYTITGTIG